MTRTRCRTAMGRLGRFAPGLAALGSAALLLATLLAAVAQAGTMQASWRLAVAPAAVARAETVLLGDIARPVGELPAEHWQTLAATPLWPAPAREGEQQNIARGKLASLLRFHLGDLAQLCVVSGPLTVQRGGRLLDEAELRTLVAEALTARVSGMQGEVSLRDFRLPGQVFLADAQNSLAVDVAGGFGPGRLSLLLREVNPAEITVRKYGATVFLDQWMSVACAARPINPREDLTPDKVTFMRKNAAYLRGEPWDGRRFGLRAVRPMGTGEIIYKANLDDVPLVSRGDTLTLVYEGSHVRLMAQVEALADGRLGDTIVVRNKDSKREIVAEIRDAETVVVR
ncbi:flagellar basal body P-ring formation chaperone FlgA [Desulfocurvus vexinensis]|uniref:flagellar basal body P-ring formation chaperone FlgA n=1 Tax=Desulfocurvus vexinensis TaxID=399548 RepID=UPI000A031A69|nr:flagellar basal body P-ring formation chaperone FlgA [Desulfocurvus vexinensis]